MKNVFLILSVIFLIANISMAQKAEIIGRWNLTKMQKGDKIKTVDSGVIFEKGGITKLGFFKMDEIMEAGTWEYLPDDNSILMVSAVDKTVNGKAEIIKITNDELRYQKDGIIYSLVKYVESEEPGAMLDFSETDFFTEDGEYKYEGEEVKLPWKDPSEMLMSLVNVKHLAYRHSKLNEQTNTFDDKILTADVVANPEEMSLSIDNIFYGFDRYNLPEDMELPPNNEYSNLLYPVEEFYFRVVSTEKITTAAGTFLCSVIEAAEAEIQKKLWMINDKPGIYAKVIVEKPGMFGAYSLQIFELEEIKQ